LVAEQACFSEKAVAGWTRDLGVDAMLAIPLESLQRREGRILFANSGPFWADQSCHSADVL
jgi:hypothetical protein